MGRLIPIVLLVILLYIFNVSLNASDISYNDIAVPTNYDVTSRDFRYVNLNINGKQLDYADINIIEQTPNYILASYSEDSTVFNFQININRNDITDTINSVNEHSLEVDDQGPIINTDTIVCNVTSLTHEIVDVVVSTQSNTAGITTGSVGCDSIYINTNRNVDVININDNSKYNVDGSSVIYAEDFGFDLENAPLSTLTDEQILELANIDSNFSTVNILDRGEYYVTFSDGNQTVTSEVFLDQTPQLEMEEYYELNFNNNEELVDVLNIRDDNDDIDNLTIEYEQFNNPGIYESTVKITDSNFNTTTEEVLVIVNDGRYFISDDERYVIENESREVMLGDDELKITVYDIPNRKYVDIDSQILFEDEEEIIVESVNNEYEHIERNENNNHMLLTYIGLFVIILGLIKFL